MLKQHISNYHIGS